MANSKFDRLLRDTTGVSAGKLRAVSMATVWSGVEQSANCRLHMVSQSPDVGRAGNVLRGRIRTPEQCDEDEAKAEAMPRKARHG